MTIARKDIVDNQTAVLYLFVGIIPKLWESRENKNASTWSGNKKVSTDLFWCVKTSMRIPTSNKLN